MRILVPLLLCVSVLWEVDASKNEQDAKRTQNLEILLPKRKADVSRKDSYVAKPSTTVVQTVGAPQPEKTATHTAGQENIKTEKKPELVPLSYEFSYGTPTHSHVQNKHPNGIIKGRYVIHAPNGQHRTVEYVADKGGFRAGVATNEPGTESASGGGSTIVSTAVEAPSKQVEPPQLAPLRIIDIQPFPAPLMRYEVAPNQPAPVPVHLISPASNSEQLPHQGLPPQLPTVPLVHTIPGVAQSIRLVQTPVFNQQPPIAHQQFLVNHGQFPLLTPPDFDIIGQSDVPNDGTQQNQILPAAPQGSPNSNNFEHFSNQEVLNRGPQVNVHPPQPIPSQGQSVFQVPGFFAGQPTIQVAPPPAVQPPPPPVIVAPPPPSSHAHVAPAPRAHLAPLNQNSLAPQEMNIESPRSQAQIEHVKLSGHKHAIDTSSTGGIQGPDRYQSPPLVHTVIQSGKPMRMPTIQPTNDAQIFEVKTKVIDHGEVPLNNNPRQLTRNLPFNGPILAAIKVADFSTPRDRVRNPGAIFKNLPPPSRRPPPSESKQPEPLIFLAIPPSGQAPKPQARAKTADLSKLFDAMPGPTVHDVAMHKFFNNIKEHHQNEVKFVKKHEHEFQALASRVMPFLLKKRMSASPHMHPQSFL